MKKIALITLVCCSLGLLFPAGSFAKQVITEKPDWQKFFKGRTTDGTLLVFDLKKDEYLVYNNARAEKRYSPASTFKIPNSLFALESGVIKDPNKDIIKWDGVKRDLPEWNQDQTLQSAYKVSAVWVYQELARRIGLERMKHYVENIDYGNKDVSAGVDKFWLDSSLQITAFEQVGFLKKLYNSELPFQKTNQEKLKDVMLLEETADYKLRAKTGWARDLSKLGWFVGWVESKDDTYFFAMNMNTEDASQLNFRKDIVKDALHEMTDIVFQETK